MSAAKNSVLVGVSVWVGVSVLALGRASTAQAAFDIILDCHGNNGLPNWPASDCLHVAAWFNDGNGAGWQFRLDSNECARDNSQLLVYSGSYTENDVHTLRIISCSSNAAWLDKVTLTGPEGTGNRTRWGTDDNLGWCFSDDSHDFNATYNLPDGFCRSEKFLYK